MLRKVIYGNIQGRKVFILFILTNLVYLLMFNFTITWVMGFGNGMKLLDMMPLGYNLEYVTALLDALGQEGRDAYLFTQIPVDMVYPGLFGITYCLLIAYFLNKLNKLEGNLYYLCLVPLLAGLADYLENMGIINLLTSYPDFSNTSVAVTNIFTLVKSGATVVYYVMLMITIVMFAIKAIRKVKIHRTKK